MKIIEELFTGGKCSKFSQNFMRVAKANAISKVLPLLAAPLITRLYQPSEFAEMAIFIASLSIMASISTGRFDWILPNAKTNSMAKSLFLLGAGCLLCITIVLGTILTISKFLNLNSSVHDNIGNYIYLLPIGVFLLGGQYLVEGWFIRCNDLIAVSRSRVLESTVQVSARISFGYAGMATFGLVTAVLLSTFLSFIFMALSARRMLIDSTKNISSIRIKTALMRYKREAAWSTLVSAVNASSAAAPIILLYQFYPAKEVGWYALMVAFAFGPISMISSALGQSFWGEAASLARDGRINTIKTLYLQLTRRLITLSIGIIIICAAAPWYVGPLLGEEEWSGAGTILLMMTPALIGSFIFSSSNHLVVYGKQKWQFFSDSLNIGIGLIIIYLGGRYNLVIEATILLFSIASLFTYVLRFNLHLIANSNYVKEQYNF